MRILAATVLALCFSVSAARPQSCLDTAADRGGKISDDLFTGDRLGPPWRRSQLLIRRHYFDNVPVRITGLAFLPIETSRVVTIPVLRVRMAHTQNDVLNRTFDMNFSSTPETVVDAHDVAWPQAPETWAEIDLQKPFLYLPTAGNLLIDVVVMGVTTDPRWYYAHSGLFEESYITATSAAAPPTSGAALTVPIVRVCIDTPRLGYYGTGCPGSAGTRPGLGLTGSSQLGQTVQFVLSNTVPSASATLVLGFSNASPLPIDLTPIGMTDCKLYVDIAVTFGTQTDGLGIASRSLRIPSDPALVSAVVYSQYFVLDPTANATGLVSSNYGRLVVGQ